MPPSSTSSALVASGVFAAPRLSSVVYPVHHTTSGYGAWRWHLGAHQRAVLGEKTRLRAGRDPQPSAGILEIPRVGEDHQSVGGVRGYDGAKKLSGRKRHLLVDTLGLVLKARVLTRRTCRTAQRYHWRLQERPKNSLTCAIYGSIRDTRAPAQGVDRGAPRMERRGGQASAQAAGRVATARRSRRPL
jgi:hypothetical protein